MFKTTSTLPQDHIDKLHDILIERLLNSSFKAHKKYRLKEYEMMVNDVTRNDSSKITTLDNISNNIRLMIKLALINVVKGSLSEKAVSTETLDGIESLRNQEYVRKIYREDVDEAYYELLEHLA